MRKLRFNDISEIFPHLSRILKIKFLKKCYILATLVMKRLEFNRFRKIIMYLCNQSQNRKKRSKTQLTKTGDKRVSFAGLRQSNCSLKKIDVKRFTYFKYNLQKGARFIDC